MHLSDEQWALLQPLFLPPSPGRGRPLLDERLVLDGILWKLSRNAPWYDLPFAYPSYQTCYRRYLLWKRTGLFQDILRLLYQDLQERGGFDLSSALADGSIHFQQDGSRCVLVFPPVLKDTWQFSIVSIFIGLALKKARARLERSRRGSP